MKTLRIAMIATLLVAFAAASMANTDGIISKKTKKVVNLTFQQAIKHEGLVAEMYKQLDDEFLNNNQSTYTVSVIYSGTIFRITGTFEQWTMFFRLKWYYSHNQITAQPKE